MMHLRKRIISLLHQTASRGPCPHISPPFCLDRRHFATKCVGTKPFAVEEYLVATCGLTQAQALKASKRLSHLKGPSQPDAVVACLSNLGLSGAEVATVVAKDPVVLCADVQRITTRVAELTGLGLSRPQIIGLLIVGHHQFRHRSLRLNLEFWISVFGSLDVLMRAVKVNANLLSKSIEKVGKPNLALLEGCGISVSDVPSTFMCRVLTADPKNVKEALTRLHELRIQQGTALFFRGLYTFAIMGSEKITKNIQLFEKLGWSKDDIISAVRSYPAILGFTEERIRRSMEFLIGHVGLEVQYVVERPVLISYNIDRRLLPRNYLMNFLRVMGLLSSKPSFLTVAQLSNEKFVCQYVLPYEESVPGLAAVFASSCAGEHQWEQLYKMIGKRMES